MKMANEIGVGLLLAVILGISIAVILQAINFIYDVPKQLKRIADALEKEKKDGKKNTIIIFCPNCNTEFKVSKKDWEKNTSGLPTCGCGTKMGIDLTDETNGETTSTEN